MASSALSSHAPLGPPTTSSSDPADPDGRRSTPVRSRPLGRRPALPGSRAVVGGLLVTLAAIGTFVAASSASGGPTTSIVVATRPLAAGDTIGAADLRAEGAEIPDAVRDTLFGSPAELDGAVVLAAVDAGAAVPRSAVSTSPAADARRTHDLSFALDRDRALNGRVRRGELVDLVATTGTGPDATTEVVVRGVRVVDLDAPTSSGVASSATVTLTIALEHEADVLRTAHALETASVTLVRSTGTTDDAVAPDPDPAATGAGSDGRPPGTGPGPGPSASTADPPAAGEPGATP